ncbi:hypothetical protein M9H77_02962 [Catharanthus roseus]|uniref:Uncharacterized protein n=1 Tax=Catharanthus roseus TaxID=4058 RepID=A0ACC0CAB7_CATRO|nr:hypothetical protein M9H77_02962 [Catharanthus roseus]
MRRLAKSNFARRSSHKRTTEQKETSRIGSTCQLLIERYKSQEVLVRVPALDPVWVPMREADHHELLGIGSTTILPLYSYSDRTAATNTRRMSIAPFTGAMEYHRSDRVSDWESAYSNMIAGWNTRYTEAYPPRDPIHVYL